MIKDNLVFGVGVNDVDYRVNLKSEQPRVDGKRVQKVVWVCPFYSKWQGVLERCYSKKFQQDHPTYLECTVDPEWLYLSNFRDWMSSQDWEGKHLDKDILFPGNRTYSPETCVFVTQEVNNFLTDRRKARGQWPIGVYWNKKDGKFRSQISADGIIKYLGSFDTPDEAHQTWLREKLRLAKILASKQADERISRALIDRYENYRRYEIE